MSDHERLHEQREQEADALEQESERVGDRVEEAKQANETLRGDRFIAHTPDEPEGERD